MPKESLEQIVNLMVDDFTKGLSADEQKRSESPVKMLLTYVRAIPDGTEQGDFLALDLGGTNFRVLLISLNQGHVTMESDIYPLDQALMTSDGKTLFGYIAGCISLFVKKNKINGQSLPLGFTFSFPVHQLSLTSGLLIKWTKGFSASGVENEDVVQLLKEALVREGVVGYDVKKFLSTRPLWPCLFLFTLLHKVAFSFTPVVTQIEYNVPYV